MRVRNIATAFLMNGDDILMTMRSMTRKIAPGLWYGVGGHVEPEEIDNPLAACLREIQEETGLAAGHILDLRLRYMVMRRSHQDLVINYFFFGRTDTRDVAPPDGEDTLHWIPRREALERPFFPAIGMTLAHFLAELESAAEQGPEAEQNPAAAREPAADRDSATAREPAPGRGQVDADRLQLGLMTLADGQPAIEWQTVYDWADPA